LDILKTLIAGLILLPVIWLVMTFAGWLLGLVILLGLASGLMTWGYSRQRRLDRAAREDSMRVTYLEYRVRQSRLSPSLHFPTSSKSSVPSRGPAGRR